MSTPTEREEAAWQVLGTARALLEADFEWRDALKEVGRYKGKDMMEVDKDIYFQKLTVIKCLRIIRYERRKRGAES